MPIRPHNPGFTLVETVLSISIMLIVSGAVMSVTMLCAKSMPSPNASDVLEVKTREANSRITADIAQAKTIVSHTATSITFTVADRNEDGADDTISYRWSGTAGDPLEWQFNTGAWATALTGVQGWILSFRTQNITRQVANGNAWGAEELLCSYEGTPNQSHTVSTSAQLTQDIRPNLPTDATAWRVTRVVIPAKVQTAGTTDCFVTLDVRSQSVGLGLTAIQSASGTLPGLTSGSWTNSTLTFATPVSLVPATDHYFYLRRGTALATAGTAAVAYSDQDGGAGRLATAPNILTWTVAEDASLAYKAYGQVERPTTMSQAATVATYVNSALRVTSGGGAVSTTAMLDRPDLP